MSLNAFELEKGFQGLGLKNGDTVLVHSSLKSLGYVEGGAAAVIEGLMRAVGNEGTLIVPTLTGKREDSAQHPPVFNVMETPCWTGTIPETARKMEGARRSLHPTHSVAALGYGKKTITEGHEFSKSPCDEKSPYYKNALINGYILLIGVDQESNTSIHSCEEIAGVPYHLQKDTIDISITGYNGERICVSNRLHEWNKAPTDFNRLDFLYEKNGIMKISGVGCSVIRLINAHHMFDYTISLLKKDPLFLVA